MLLLLEEAIKVHSKEDGDATSSSSPLLYLMLSVYICTTLRGNYEKAISRFNYY
jgi:hypothetical protein